ncbi:MAG: TIR domain-containing protein [Verrucomicrobia bacterium]|nr:TIR domain-containing protein [Verrucomicrobiota bacterium]
MSNPPPTPAVFLSYAHEDAETARRIAEALRGAGLTVWFDEDELRGGDAWDRKIRQQIDGCTLFVPIISRHTEARAKGYFRLEWKLAVDQTHLLAEGVPYLAPVAIDDTREATAMVPAEFRKVQWTRLPDGRPTAAFAEQIKRLLERTPFAGVTAAPMPMRAAPPAVPAENARAAEMRAPPPVVSRRVPATAWIAVLAVGFGGVAVYYATRKAGPASPAPTANAGAGTRPPITEKAAAPAADAKSVAVLPFENLSAEPDGASFVDGMHEEVRSAIAKVSALKVIGRSSVLPYADAKTRDLRAIASKLGVAHVVEGTVQRRGSRVRIGVQLLDAQTSRQVWGDSYEKELTDTFAIQSAIAQEIAGALKASLTAGERATLGQQLTRNAEAYRLYLQAASTVRSIGIPTVAGRTRLESAIAATNQAVQADPNFVLPHVQLAWLHTVMFWFGELDPVAERARLAETSAETVRRLAPGSVEARLATGYVLYACRNDWAAALAEFRGVLVERPNDTEALRYEGNALRRLGRWPEAVAAFARAAARDPQWLIGTETLIETQVIMRRHAQAMRAADDLAQLITISPLIIGVRTIAQFADDGDFPTYRRNLRGVRAELQGFLRQAMSWHSDLLARDWTSAATLLESGGATLAGLGGVVNNPMAHYRALLAYMQGDGTRARGEAVEARRYFENGVWTKRQEAVVAAELALACALAGDAPAARVALQRSRDLLRQRPDAFIEVELHPHWGATLIVLGEREAALAELRVAFGGATPVHFVPPAVRLDPLWSRLKDDPRFEEILKAAKPL